MTQIKGGRSMRHVAIIGNKDVAREAMSGVFALTLLICVILSFREMDERTSQLVKNLRESVEVYKREVWSLRDVVKEHKGQVKALKHQLNEIHQSNALLVQSKDEMQKEIERQRNCNNALHPVLVNKTFDSLISNRARNIRKRKYKKLLDESVGCITECKRAKLTLGFEKGHCDIVWSEEEMNRHRQIHKVPNRRYNLSTVTNVRTANLRQTRPVNKISEFVTDEGLFTSKCKYSDKHIRKVVSVLDENRISQKAYQQLKNVCKGHMPTLNQIKDQKFLMSIQLPLYSHTEVGLFV